MHAHFNTVQGLYNALQASEVTENDICFCDENNAIYTKNRWYGLPEAQSGGDAATAKQYGALGGGVLGFKENYVIEFNFDFGDSGTISADSVDNSYNLGVANLMYNLTIGERVEFTGSEISISNFNRVFPYSVVRINGISFPAKATYDSVGGCDTYNVLIDNVMLMEFNEVKNNMNMSIRVYLTLL